MRENPQGLGVRLPSAAFTGPQLRGGGIEMRAAKNLERRVSLAPLSPDVISPPQDENRKASRKSRADYRREQRTGQSHGAGAR